MHGSQRGLRGLLGGDFVWTSGRAACRALRRLKCGGGLAWISWRAPSCCHAAQMACLFARMGGWVCGFSGRHWQWVLAPHWSFCTLIEAQKWPEHGRKLLVGLRAWVCDVLARSPCEGMWSCLRVCVLCVLSKLCYAGSLNVVQQVRTACNANIIQQRLAGSIAASAHFTVSRPVCILKCSVWVRQGGKCETVRWDAARQHG